MIKINILIPVLVIILTILFSCKKPTPPYVGPDGEYAVKFNNKSSIDLREFAAYNYNYHVDIKLDSFKFDPVNGMPDSKWHYIYRGYEVIDGPIKVIGGVNSLGKSSTSSTWKSELPEVKFTFTTSSGTLYRSSYWYPLKKNGEVTVQIEDTTLVASDSETSLIKNVKIGNSIIDKNIEFDPKELEYQLLDVEVRQHQVK